MRELDISEYLESEESHIYTDSILISEVEIEIDVEQDVVIMVGS